jgi:molecular chaperone GrpE
MKENKEVNELADKAAETPVEEEVVKTDATGEEAAASEEAAEDGKAEKPAEPDWKALYAITLADFDNYKKRAARDREDVYRYAESDILKDVLPSVDNLALALDKAADKEDPFVKGVQLVYDTLLKALEGHGAKPMENPLGKELDPNFHEAIATLPDEKYEEGKISNIVKTGWMLGDKLLRVAQVVVSSGKKQ